MIKNLLLSATAKDSVIMLFGTIFATALGLFVTIILTRNLSTSDFGLIITGLAFTHLMVDLFELGIGSAIINFLSKATNEQRNSIIKVSFVLRLIFSLFISVLIFVFSRQIALFVFNNIDFSTYIQTSSIGVLFLNLINWSQSVFQAEKKFIRSTISAILINGLRLLAIGLLLWFGIKSPLVLYTWMQIVVGFSLFYIFLTINSFYNSKSDKKLFLDFLRFGIPVGLGFSFAAITARLDQLLVFNYLGQDEAGIYGLSSRLVSLIVFATAAFGHAVAPRFTTLHNDDFSKYFQKVVLVMVVLAVLAIISIFISPIMIPYIFGINYQDAVLIYQILVIGIIFFIFSAPFSLAILYRYNSTKFTFILSLISLIILWQLFNILVPSYKSIGAAISLGLVYFFQFIVTVVYFLYLKKYKKT